MLKCYNEVPDSNTYTDSYTYSGSYHNLECFFEQAPQDEVGCYIFSIKMRSDLFSARVPAWRLQCEAEGHWCCESFWWTWLYRRF